MSDLARGKIGPHTWDDFIALDEDDLRELIDGELVEVEVPKRIHEAIVAVLVFLLTQWARRRGGLVFPSGYKLRISERRGVMPDVQLYRAGNEPLDDQEDGLVRGAPDLVVEVVSPSSRRYDRVVKLGYYAQLKVPEYWIVDPSTSTLERLVYSKRGYVIAATKEGRAVFAPPSLPGLKIRLPELWSPILTKRPGARMKEAPQKRKPKLSSKR
jgi:Uma2 family endonuclease